MTERADRIIQACFGGAFLGMALVGAAIIAGMVAREGLGADFGPANTTASFLCYFSVGTLAIACGFFATAASRNA